MKSKKEIITEMCYTYRHDYGLDKNPDDPSWCAGMTPDDRTGLYRTMEQIYTNNFEPFIKEFNDLKEGRSVQIPQSKEHAALMYKLASMYLGENYEQH